MKQLIVLVGLLLMQSALVQRVQAEEVTPAITYRDIVLDRAAAYGISGWWLLRVGYCESGLDPWAEGDYRWGRPTSHGAFQLHEGGLLTTFYVLGYDDPYNIWESADFAAYEFSIGGSSYWSCT